MTTQVRPGDTDGRVSTASGSASSDEDGRLRPDPFLLISDTPFRFALLIVAVLSASLFAYQVLFLTFHPAQFEETFTECFAQAPSLGAEASVQERGDAARQQALCRQGFTRYEAIWVLTAAAGLIVLAVAMLQAVPLVRGRRGRFTPLADLASTQLEEHLAGLGRRAGVHRVHYLVDLADGRTSAFTYGSPRRRRIVLRAGLITKWVTAPEAFDAVVLHELAHVRNRDVDQTYLSLCTAAAFVVGAVLPFAAVLGGSLPLLPMLTRGIALTLLVYLLLVALLRSREQYADARARQWGAGPALAELLSDRGAQQHHERRWRLPALHPAPEVRARALEDPTPLFRLSAWDALAVGLVASLAVPQVTSVAGLAVAGSLTSSAAGVAPFALLVGGFFVVGIWRQCYLEALTGRRERVWPLGVGLGVGLALGPTLAVQESAGGLGDTGSLDVLWHAVWVGIVVLLLAPLASWVAEGARTSAKAHVTGGTSGRALRTRCAVAVVLASLAVGAVLYRLEFLRDLTRFQPGSDAWSVVASTTTLVRGTLGPSVLRSWVHLLVLAAVVALVVTAGPLARRSALRAVVTGSLTGLVVVALVVAAIGSSRDYAVEQRWSVAFEFHLVTASMTAACLLCAAGGLVAAAGTRSRRLAVDTGDRRDRPLALGALGALGAALVGGTVLLLLRPAQSCLPILRIADVADALAPACPSFSTWAFARQVAAQVLAGGVGATLLLLPLLLALAQPVLRVLDRSSAVVRALAGVTASVLLVGGVLVAAERIAARAAAASGDAPGDVGDGGVVRTPDFSVPLVRGWFDVTGERQSKAQFPTATLVLADTDGSGIVTVNRTGPGLLDLVNADDSLEVRRAAPVDGARALEVGWPDGPDALRLQWVTEHADAGYVIQLYGTPDGQAGDRHDVRRMVRAWQWE